MSRNFHALLAMFFGVESQVTKAASAWIGHMLKWEAVYETQHSDDPTFMTQVLFAIDSMVTLHLECLCLKPESWKTRNPNIAGGWGGGAGRKQEQDKNQPKAFSMNPKFCNGLFKMANPTQMFFTVQQTISQKTISISSA